MADNSLCDLYVIKVVMPTNDFKTISDRLYPSVSFNIVCTESF